MLVPDGERYKQLPTVSRVYDALVKANADRASTLITFGGGVIGDLAGFAAATYLRGIALVHVPTTLLAQVDSCDRRQGRREPPARQEPASARFTSRTPSSSTRTVLGTLPRREFRAGLYEVIKYGMTSSPTLFERVARERKAIFARDPGRADAVIAESCRIKADVVRPTSGSRACAASSTSATPPGTRWKR